MNAKRIAWIVAMLPCLVAIAQTTAPADRAARWRADLTTLKQELPRLHVNPFTKTSRADFEAAIDSLAKRVDKLADHEIVVGMMQIVASIGDAHTMIGFGPQTPGSFPIGIYICKDGPFVAVSTTDQRELLGAKVLKVGTLSFDNAAKRVAGVFPSENESHLKQNLPRWITNAQVLHALKITDRVDRATFEFQLADGSAKRVELSPVAIGSKPKLVRLPDWSKLKRPISMTPHATRYWFEFDEPTKVIYARYDACVHDPKYPFAQFSKELLAAIDAKKPAKVIFDVRNNGGGNSAIAEPLINALRDNNAINQKGKLFVVIGRATFSSAQMNAQQFRDRTNATVVGEPTGQKPNHFGEIKNFTLPKSGLIAQYSTKQFRQSEKDEPSMMPDEVIEPTSAEFFAGKDVVLERVLRP
ncbi:MAG: hypothetical protein H7Z14_22160 [Anaerolineae bacterium]|nr:hypothetical protein [Phycisphaerae bacterium]